MIRIILLVLGLQVVGLHAKTTSTTELDKYISTFNRVFEIANRYPKNPGRLLRSSLMAQLSPEERKTISKQMTLSPASNVMLVREGTSVYLKHRKTGLTLTRFDVKDFYKTGIVRWGTSKIHLRESIASMNFQKASKMYDAGIEDHQESLKPTRTKLMEIAFSVATLPFQAVMACGKFNSNLRTDAYLAAAASTFMNTAHSTPRTMLTKQKDKTVESAIRIK